MVAHHTPDCFCFGGCNCLRTTSPEVQSTLNSPLKIPTEFDLCYFKIIHLRWIFITTNNALGRN
jgi:hypothetical protein